MILFCRYGEFLVPESNDLIINSLRLYGEWAQIEINILSNFIESGNVVIDAGSFLGTHARAFSAMVGQTGKVHAFEPNNQIIPYLKENAVKKAPILNTVVHPYALGEANKWLTLVSEFNDNLGSSRLAEGGHGCQKEIVEVKALDDCGIERVNFIKADVEGMEFALLEGAEGLIDTFKPVIFTEANSLESTCSIVEWARRIKYYVYGIVTMAFNPDNFNCVHENIFGQSKECGLLLIHEDKYDKYVDTINALKLPEIITVDDLALLLLHKPQYTHEVLEKSRAALMLGIDYPLVNLEKILVERDKQIDNLKQTLVEHDKKIESLNRIIVERDEQIESLNRAVVERDEQVESLNRIIVERDEQIESLNRAVVERDEQVESLNRAVVERDEQVESLNRVVVERDEQIESLNRVIIKRDEQIESLNRIIVEHDKQIANLSKLVTKLELQLSAIITSRSWKLTKPFRLVGRFFRGEFALAFESTKKLFIKPFNKQTHNHEEKYEIESVKRDICFEPSVVVILPVYRDIEMTRRCILSAMPDILNSKTAVLLAINDVSPEDGMSEMLEEFAKKWPEKFMLLHNNENLGFVRTINKGLRYYPNRDVVLLNSDVIVPKNWLYRLIKAAYSLSNVATVTPISNNATICSFPIFLKDNELPFGLNLNSIDKVFGSHELPCIEAPTGVGFCMYIRRSCLNKIGYLDEEHFGRGYGEENDLCQRALKSGWVNLVTPNLFVFHKGGVSFSNESQALIERAMRTMDKLHPNYHRDVKEFINNDPLRPLRIYRYIQLLSIVNLPKVLFVSHELGGGVKQHIEELSKYHDNNAAFLLLKPLGGSKSVVLHLICGQVDTDELLFSMPDDYCDLSLILKVAGISLVHFHHTHGLNPIIWSLPSDLGVPHILTVHDYYWLNGNPTLTNEKGFYEGPPYDTHKNPLYPLPEGVDAQIWRENLRPLIESANMVIFPSHATRRIFDNSYKFKCSIVTPHVEIGRDVTAPVKPFISSGIVNIGVLGALSREKGADFLEDVALTAKRLGYEFNFILIGYAYRPLKVVDATGPYQLDDLPKLIKEHNVNIVFFPAQWPETYSYTLSYSLDSGLPIVAPDIGAFSERLSNRQNVLLFKHGTKSKDLLRQLNQFIDRILKNNDVNTNLTPDRLEDYGFYSKDYLSIAAETLCIKTIEHSIYIQLADVVYQRATTRSFSLKHERVYIFLWRIYNRPFVYRLTRWIPCSIRRAIKLMLSNRPINEIWGKAK